MSARPRYGRSASTSGRSRSTSSPGSGTTAATRTRSSSLVRKAIGGRDEGVDAVGCSCFGHSLIALDADGVPLTPLLGWRDTRSADAAEWLRRRVDPAAVQARTGAHLHPSFWPAKLAWLAETEPDVFRGAARFVSFCDYLYEQLRGAPPSVQPLDCFRHRAARPERPALGRRAARGAEGRRVAPAAHLRRSRGRLVPRRDRRRLLESRCRLHRQGTRGAHGRHVGSAPDPLRDRAPTTASRALPVPARRAARRRGRCALGRRQPLCVAEHDACRGGRRAWRRRPRRPRSHVSPVPRRRALDGLGSGRERRDRRPHLRHDRGRHPPGRARGRRASVFA